MTLALAPGYESAKSYYDRPLVDLSELPRDSCELPSASDWEILITQTYY